MKKSFAYTVLVMLAVAVSGCATPTKMAFEGEDGAAVDDTKPIFLMTATIKNEYKESYQPKLLVVNVEKAEVKSSDDRINFYMDEKAKIETDSLPQGNTYLLRMQLDSGDYVIKGLSCTASRFPFNATFFAPIHASLRAAEPGVYYLGRVTATVRERKGDEFKAGPSIPLIDQAMAGASGGTFEIEISDEFDTDEGRFRTRFAALDGADIRKAILPPFDREKAQKYWESH